METSVSCILTLQSILMHKLFAFLLLILCQANYGFAQTNTIHVFVALCDNTYQGIVPVGAKIGNGQDPDNNLYWGCNNGVRTYFKKSREWQFISSNKPGGIILERIIFKHRIKNYYLVADAYDGKYIKDCTIGFLNNCAGKTKETITVGNVVLKIGDANLVAYIGHNGLMDFTLPLSFKNLDGKQRETIILACISKGYFDPYLLQTKSQPLLWTTGLMAPEAYTLHDAITGYINSESDESIRTRGANAYAKFQKCSIKAARNLLVTGW